MVDKVSCVKTFHRTSSCDMISLQTLHVANLSFHNTQVIPNYTFYSWHIIFHVEQKNKENIIDMYMHVHISTSFNVFTDS